MVLVHELLNPVKADWFMRHPAPCRDPSASSRTEWGYSPSVSFRRAPRHATTAPAEPENSTMLRAATALLARSTSPGRRRSRAQVSLSSYGHSTECPGRPTHVHPPASPLPGRLDRRHSLHQGNDQKDVVGQEDGVESVLHGRVHD